jgi:hypothetical protein
MELEDLKPEEIKQIDTVEKVFIKENKTFNSAKYVLVFAIIILSILCILSHVYDWKVKVDIKDIMSVCTFIIVFATCLYHAKNLKTNIDANNAKLNFDFKKLKFETELKQKENKLKVEKESSEKEEKISKEKNIAEYNQKLIAYQICKNWTNPDFNEHIKKARHLLKNSPLFTQLNIILPTDKDKLLKWEEDFDKEPDRKSIVILINYFEETAIAIKHGLAHEQYIKDNLGTIMKQYFFKLQKYIDFKQNHPSPEYRSKSYYISYENLIKEWHKDEFKGD